MGRGEEGRVYFCPHSLGWMQYLCRWAQSKLLTHRSLQNPNAPYVNTVLGSDISKSAQVTSLELVNTQKETSYVTYSVINLVLIG